MSAFSQTTSPKKVDICQTEIIYYATLIEKEISNTTGKPKLGAVNSYAYTLSKELNGNKIGEVFARRIDLGLENVTPGPHSMMETSATFFLDEGTLVSLTVVDYDKQLFRNKTVNPIVGGTGKYRAAHGEMVFEIVTPGDKPVYKLNLNLNIPCAN